MCENKFMEEKATWSKKDTFAVLCFFFALTEFLAPAGIVLGFLSRGAKCRSKLSRVGLVLSFVITGVWTMVLLFYLMSLI